MKLKVKSFFICLILIVFSCSKKNSSPELEKHFTKNQIEDLNKINDFFISEFLKSEKRDFKDAYLKFKDSLKFNGKFSDNDTELFKKQLELYNTISKSTFNEIWALGITQDAPYPNEEYIDANVFGKYYLFVKELKKNNEFAKICYDRMERTGDYNAMHLDSYFYHNHDTFNYDEFHNQLILAIYYLTAIDNYERDHKRKERFKEFEEKAKLEFE